MSKPSQWPLTHPAVRQVTPGFMLRHLQQNPLTRACYPTAFGYYPEAFGHHMQRQRHSDNLLIYCTDGIGHVETTYYQGPVKAGDILLLPRGQIHQYHADANQPWTIYWVHFEGLQAHQLIAEFKFEPDQALVSIGQQPLLLSDLKRLLSLRQSGYRHSVYNYAAALTRQILYFLALEIRSRNSMQRHNFNLDAVQSLMLENIDGELNLETLASSAQLSPNHFANKYKKLTGISPIKHFIHLKMERACYLLDTSHRSAKQISAELGYTDPLYFSRLFKKVIGLSPSDYRQQQHG
jgi:AraC-like DNA-binding protein